MKEKELSDEIKDKFPILAHLGVYELDDDCEKELNSMLTLDLDLGEDGVFIGDEDDINLDNNPTPSNKYDSVYAMDDFFKELEGIKNEVSDNE